MKDFYETNFNINLEMYRGLGIRLRQPLSPFNALLYDLVLLGPLTIRAKSVIQLRILGRD